MRDLNGRDKHNVIEVEEIFGIGDSDCIFDNGNTQKCQYLQLRVTNFNKTAEEISRLPQVLITAGFIGSDRIGSTAVLEFAEEIMENVRSLNSMLNSIVLYLVPVSNPIGFSRGQSNDNGAVPTCDFPLFYIHQGTAGGSCLSSESSRFINEIIRKSMISAAIVIGVSTTTLTKLSKYLALTFRSPDHNPTHS